jgi:pimeloyl-[acyl-carrier protein] methyl ester esterase
MKKHLVMLHGFGCDSRIFNSIASKLSKDYDPVIVDLPGHGQTKEKFGDFSFCAYTLLNVLDQFLNEPYHLLGWSMGGQIALEMFKQKSSHKCQDEQCHHNPIESLILISSTPKFVESKDFRIGMNKAVFNKFKKGIKNDTSKTMDDFYGLIFSKEEDSSDHLNFIKSLVPSPQTLFDCMESFEKFDERNILPGVSIPTLIISGDKDGIISPKASMYMSQEIKGSVIKIFKDCGHAPFLIKEKEVVDELSRFLG